MTAQRWILTVEYDGAPFAGWQRQEGAVPTVQGALEAAVRAFCGQTAAVHGAGRTDAGVHAAGQVAHVDLARPCAPEEVIGALNAHLRPAPVAVLAAAPAPPDFHARFTRNMKTYRYRILARPAPPALDAGRVWHLRGPLDVGAMRAAAGVLVGHHDFTSFRAAGCQGSGPVRTLDALEVAADGAEVVLTARARSFLHNQVRIIVGTLAKVGRGVWSAGDVARILAARDRTQAGPTAPPQGLTLMEVDYD
jgi:tRNA pseudouridine38-40 synthase